MMTNVLELTPMNLQEICTELEYERKRLAKQLAADPQQERDSFGRNPDRFDLASSYTTFVQRTVLHTMDQKKLNQIEEALQRLDAGLYGRCTACGEAIEAERLAILPATTLCIGCQQCASA